MTDSSATTPAPVPDAASETPRSCDAETVQAQPRDGVQAPLTGVAQLALQSPKLRGVTASVGAPRLHVSAIDEARPWVTRAIAEKSVVIVVTATGREAQDLTAELREMMGDAVALFPAWETLPHERLSPSSETIGARLRVLRRLTHPDDIPGQKPIRIIVAPARSFIQPIMKGLGEREPILLAPDTDVTGIATQLAAMGYQHVDLVGKRGEFAVRGGVIDVFPSTADLPVRVELWGDEISDVRAFSVGDQRTIDHVDPGIVPVYPCRELLINDAVRDRAQAMARTHASNATLADAFMKISEGIAVEGMESLIPVLVDGPMVTLPEEVAAADPSSTPTVLVMSPEKVQRRAEDLIATGEEFIKAGWNAAAMGAEAPIDTAALAEGHEDDYELNVEQSAYRSLGAMEKTAENKGLPWWTCAPPGFLGTADLSSTLELDFTTGPQPKGKPGDVEKAMTDLVDHVTGGGRLVYTALTPASAKRMATRFKEAGIGVATDPDPQAAPTRGQATIIRALLHGGLIIPHTEDTDTSRPLLIVAETDFTGNRIAAYGDGRRRPQRKRNRVDPLSLSPGDFVVHETHGIGRFVKMQERTVGKGEDATRREYMVLEYAPSKRGGASDHLYVPMDSLDLLSRYVGGENPSLSKMGGSDWKNTKKKARAAVRDIAADLVQLYAKRQAAPGHAFASDSPWQREMEDNFPFTETEDQYNAIESVKADMEKPVPMDRVIVGDVGYGKTEVAVRAAFKAVQDGKQVVVLVPTTLLAQQHFVTFSERMEGFPVTIRQLSRFTTHQHAREILTGLTEGEVDIVIGTHRLLQTQVQWKNLGLVIVDEEQRFGVEHKEHIKTLRSHVDMLTMSATPIPRTLEMSMAGIRDMSTILTPPEDRHPVLTYVGVQEDKQIAAAIRRELLRDGQVFYVHNRVRTIEQVAQHIRELVPEARVVVAHGQMSEDQLENTVAGFWDREYDVLVCTTIVETGLDISNANTLIVENAHHMGLAQLHQLRGRVGRSRERGYAYFLYPPSQTLTETSYDRLSTIAQNNDLGAGMAVAMKDLEMRGAGNVLGAEQSGHIAGVGFDLYVRLVGEAVEAFKAMADGKPIDGTDKEVKETRIDINVDAHIPISYVASERLRLAAYRDLAQAKSEQALENVRAELVDRYGQPPEEIDRLLVVARLRMVCRECGVTDVVATGAHKAAISFSPIDLPDSGRVRLARLYPGAQYRATTHNVVIPAPKKGRGIRAQVCRDEELLQWCADVMTSLMGKPRHDVCGCRAAGVHAAAGGERGLG
ncbi:transcription-repair coupling factor [Corynebacterium kroppenstedtii]|uniref:transcription-repair coupling factor n=1 Tax=Corynebacterium sp. PCR 32 TaxID=3351342 RepID=UPI0030997B15